jgi:Na+-driven multidrug efflux pump
METAAPKSETQSPLRKTDFTTDHLFKKMIQFTISIILISLFQLFFYSMDLLVVSNFGGGQTSFAAISSNNALINLYVSFFVGLSIGANVIVARARGTKNTLSAHRAIQSSMVIALISSVLVAVIGYFTARYQLIAMGTPEEILPQATLYLQLVFCGMPFVIIFNFGAACLRAMGDFKRPLYALIGCGIVNVGLKLLLVLGLGMKSGGKDVLAVGLATIVSQVLESPADHFLPAFQKERIRKPHSQLSQTVFRRVQRHSQTWRSRRSAVSGFYFIQRPDSAQRQHLFR